MILLLSVFPPRSHRGVSSIGHTFSCDINSLELWNTSKAFLVCIIHIHGNQGNANSSLVWLACGKVLSDLMDCGCSQLQILDAQHVSEDVLGHGGHFSGRIHVLDLFGLFYHQRQQALLEHVVHGQNVQLVEINLCQNQNQLVWSLHILYATHENEYTVWHVLYPTWQVNTG